MVWVGVEQIRVEPPLRSDFLIGGHEPQGRQLSMEIIRHQEIVELGFELIGGFVMVGLRSGFFQGTVCSFELPIGPGMPEFVCFVVLC